MLPDDRPVSSVSFTGTAGALSRAERVFIRAVLVRIRADRYVTGGADGVDTTVHFAAAQLWPDAKHLVLAPRAPWSERVASGAQIEFAPEGRSVSDAYMRRNDQLVAASPLLVAFPRSGVEKLRSGTWATIRRARKAGLEVRIFPLSDASFKAAWIRPVGQDA